MEGEKTQASKTSKSANNLPTIDRELQRMRIECN
jgi:hypothetical protein